MDITVNTNVDEILEGLGKWGRYQKFQLFLMLLDIWPGTFHLFSVVFIGYTPQYQCAEINSSTYGNNSLYITYEKCQINIYENDTNSTLIQSLGCVNGFKYSVPKDRTFVTQLDLVCDNAGLAELSQTLVMLGQALGAAIFTSLADRYGRKSMHIIAHICLLFIAFGLAFVDNYTTIAVLRLFIGVLQQGTGLTLAIIMIELVPMQQRYMIDVIGLVMWTTGVSLVAVFGYFMRDLAWRYMQMAMSLFSVYSLIQYWIVDESIRWLIANGKKKEAERIIRKAARWNNVKYEDVMKRANDIKMKEIMITAPNKSQTGADTLSKDTSGIIADETDDILLTSEENSSAPVSDIMDNKPEMIPQHYSFFTILKKKRVLFNSLILWYTWVVNSLTYYGIILLSSSLSGNRFLNYFLAAVIEYPAAFTEFLLINRIGRKKTCIMFHGIAGSSLIISTILTTLAGTNVTMTTASTAFTLIGKYAITGSFSTIYLYTPEMYPTNLRNAGIGFSSAAGRSGSMIAPFARTLAVKVRWAPGAIFGIICLIVTVLCTFLPETKGHVLPQTIEELNEWYKTHSAGTSRKKKEKLEFKSNTE